MIDLRPKQIEDLCELKQYCGELGAELVIIGACAYQHHFSNEERFTSDIDIVGAFELDEFFELEKRLQYAEWSQESPDEPHRWKSKNDSYIDLIPAGERLREQKKVIWPDSGYKLTLVGFDHVFELAEQLELAAELTLRIIPPKVLMLLKIIAFMDRPSRSGKDLPDIRGILERYEEGNTERFNSDVVLGAVLPDVSVVPAFLLGLDLRALCTPDERKVIEEFLSKMQQEEEHWPEFVEARPTSSDNPEETVHEILDAFNKGFTDSN